MGTMGGEMHSDATEVFSPWCGRFWLSGLGIVLVVYVIEMLRLYWARRKG